MRKVALVEGPQVDGRYIRPGALRPAKDRLPLVWQFSHEPDKLLGWAFDFRRDPSTNELSFELGFFDGQLLDLLKMHDKWDEEFFELAVCISQLKTEVIPAVDWINDENETHIVYGLIDMVAVIPDVRIPVGYPTGIQL